ncbi:MAG: ABC transporter substrate-binding protein [Proteobacteria bacterium]|nr:ABC transporter substrate-binding protein [Pseudomonadota bacterium]
MLRRIGLFAAIALAVHLGSASAQTLRIGLQDDPDSLDPHLNYSFVGRHVLASLCDKLVDIGTDQSFVPQLATAWAIATDGKSLTLKLRPGVKFHDGEPFNAAAVKYNIDRMKSLQGSRRSSEIAPVSGAEIIDDLTVKVIMATPFAPLLAQFADRAGMMVSPKAAEAAGAQFGNHVVCAGPYKFVERVILDRIVLEKFADYWAKDQYFPERVVFTAVQDPTVRLSQLKAGQFGFIERPLPTDIDSIKSDARIAYVGVTSLAYQSVIFNIANGPKVNPIFSKNAKLREAFELAIDREAIVNVIFSGAHRVGNQPVPPNSPWYAKAFPLPQRDVAKARKLVSESGVADPTFTILVPPQPERQQVVQMLQVMAKEVGITIKIQVIEFVTMLRQMAEGNFEAVLLGWSGRVDPDGNIHNWLSCKGSSNDGKYCNAEVDQALNKAREITDFAERKALYDQAAAIYLTERPIIYLYHDTWLYSFSAKLDGFTPYPDGIIRLRGVKLKS